jgi:hypothetical protein
MPASDVLCGVLRQFRQMCTVFFGRSDDLHLLPVVREFFSAIEADDIGSRQSSSLGAAHCSTNGYGKAIVSVPAAKQNVDQFLNHDPTFHLSVYQFLGCFRQSVRPFYGLSVNAGTQILRFTDCQKGFGFRGHALCMLQLLEPIAAEIVTVGEEKKVLHPIGGFLLGSRPFLRSKLLVPSAPKI